MALKVQYNKTFSQQLQKQLAIRERALPTLKNKETALRIEVKKAMDNIASLKKELKKQIKTFEKAGTLLREFPAVVKIENTKIDNKNVAGVKVPVLADLEFHVEDIHYFNQPAWILLGIENLMEIVLSKARVKVAKLQVDILNYARKKNHTEG